MVGTKRSEIIFFDYELNFLVRHGNLSIGPLLSLAIGEIDDEIFCQSEKVSKSLKVCKGALFVCFTFSSAQVRSCCTSKFFSQFVQTFSFVFTSERKFFSFCFFLS